MSYLAQSHLAADNIIMQRATACAATLDIPNPSGWVTSRQWQLSAQPGWVAAYASAIEAHKNGAPPAGENEAAITDGMILAAVQSLNTPTQ